MGLSIIIPTHNRPENLLELVRSIIASKTAFPVEIIVVNDIPDQNLSSDLPAQVNYIENKKGGVAASRNLGAKAAIHENLLFIDDDMLVSKEAIEFAESFLNTTENAVLNIDWVYPEKLLEQCRQTKFGRYLIRSGHTTLKGWMNDNDWQPGKIYEVPGLASAFLAMKKQDFESVGGYNEQFPFAGFEDHEFSTRAKSAGLNVFLNTHISVFHNEAENIVAENWLKRKYRNSFTRGVGVAALGRSDMELAYSGPKKFAFSLIYSFKPFVKFLLNLFPDRIYAAGFDKLYGAHLYAGYSAGLRSVKKSDK